MQVRRIVFLALAEKLRVDALVPAQRRVLLLRGLRDRAESVVQAATGLLNAWSASLEHDPVALVEALDDAGADGDVIGASGEGRLDLRNLSDETMRVAHALGSKLFTLLHVSRQRPLSWRCTAC